MSQTTAAEYKASAVLGEPPAHVGPAGARTYPGGVVIMCPEGHVVTTVAAADWAGSLWQARIAGGHRVTCAGATG